MHKNFKINISLYGIRSSNSNFYTPPIKGDEFTTFFYSGIKELELFTRIRVEHNVFLDCKDRQFLFLYKNVSL
jgi:hypothetical protein